MKRSHAIVAVVFAVVAALAGPTTAYAFQITGGGGTQTQNPYGLWYAGQEACAQEGCHSAIAAKPSPHSEMVTDIKMNPSQLEPEATSPLWPYSSTFGGPTIRPRDVSLQVGDGEGFHEYVGFEGSPLAVYTSSMPTDDLPLYDPMLFYMSDWAWGEHPGKPNGNGVYSQSCAQCHNLGVTRPSGQTYTLANGFSVQSKTTPTSVSGLSIQCEVCHGSGKNPSGHKNGVPTVVGGYQILKSQVCGQCHVSGFANEKNFAGKSQFSNPNGYTTDATLSAYFTPYTAVESESTFMAYVNNPSWPGVPGGSNPMIKPRFLPNGADFSLRHSYYNEWLVNKVPSGYGGDHGHADPVNEAVKSYASGGNTKCLRCHSGLGFLNRIDAKSPSGKRIVATYPTISQVATADPGISCMVCHSGHVGIKETGGYDSSRRWGNGREVGCGDCHNWQFEMLDMPVQRETIDGVEYARPSADSHLYHPQREMFTGGAGAEDGTGGLWGVKPMGTLMPDVTCKDCHMPHTHREDMPAVDDGRTSETRMSHRFHIVLPGDAERWKLRNGGDSCRSQCHKEDAADWTRADFQSWIDSTRSSVATASEDATSALETLAADYALAGGWTDFMSAKPSTGPAATLPAAKWAMLQHAAQNVDFVRADGSKGIHNPKYAIAGLQKSLLWAKSASATIDASVDGGKPVKAAGSTISGTLLGVHDEPIDGAEVVLQSSSDGGATWAQIATGRPDASGDFEVPTGMIVGTKLFRCVYAPAEGVAYASTPISVQVPVTTSALTPVSAAGGWIEAGSVNVALSATPGSLTFYSLSGATTKAQTLYTGPFDVTAEGDTTVTFWSTSAEGIEAANTQQVRIDRATPVLASDAAASYLNAATVRVSASDSGAGVASLHYSLDGGPFVAAGNTWAVCTVTQRGAHSLTARATDGAGKITTKTWAFAVKASPALSTSPSGSSYRVGLRRTWTTRAKLTAGGTALAGKSVMLQRSTNGSSWRTYATLTTDASGQVSRSIKMTSRGTAYWRWLCPEDGAYFSATGTRTKTVVR